LRDKVESRRGPGERSWPGGGGDTLEYDSELPSRRRAERLSRHDRGHWVDPEEVPRQGRSRDVWTGDETEEVDRSRRGRSVGGGDRGRRALGLAVVVIMLAGLALFAGLLVSGSVVVPLLSEKVFPIHYQEEIAWAAAEYDQDPYLVAAIIKAESGYDPEAVSAAPAYGLMQLLASTAKERASKIGKWEDVSEAEMPEFLTDPAINIELGVAYLEYLNDRYGGDSRLALAAYNGGFNNLDRWLQEAGEQESFELSDIEFPETREYVERVEHYYELYQRIHPDVF